MSDTPQGSVPSTERHSPPGSAAADKSDDRQAVGGSAALSFQRCPVWVPQNPDVPHNDRLHCILPSNHQGAHVGDERFTGLHHKYDVTRLHDVTGKHADCRYFVLDPQHDPLAREALRRYASVARERGFDQLSMDLMGWVDRCEPKPPTSIPGEAPRTAAGGQA